MTVSALTRRLLASVATLSTLALAGLPAAQAQSGDTVLVVDASNSMWGQIDGTAKIEIARSALADYVRGIAPDTRLGLFAYGHRQAGRCDDIEQVRPLGRLDADAVIADVNGLVPRGKTPLTAAVRQAAGALGPDGGTIILLTDGVETCGGDPCAMAAELAASGVQLTTHVVGFDIRTPGERASLACIARQTGGTYLDASDGAELAAAFRTAASAEPVAAASPRRIALMARRGEGGPVIADARFFLIDQASGAVVADGVTGPVDLVPGRYRAVALTDAGHGAVEADVTAREPDGITVVVATELPDAQVALEGAAQAGQVARFSWQGPDAEDDYLRLAEPDGDPLENTYSAWTRDGEPAQIRMPGEPGRYSVQYVHSGLNQVIGSAVFTVEPALASLDAPATVGAGGVLAVQWAGPGEADDWIGLVPVGGQAGDVPGQAYAHTASTQDGVLEVPAPGTSGDFELVYVLGHDQTVLARRPVTVESADALIVAPSEAFAGWSIDVTISGDSEDSDWVGVVPAGAPASEYLSSAWDHVRGASQMTLRVPAVPGAYEVRYVRDAADGSTVLASSPVTAAAGPVAIEAPASVAAGASFTVTASGPRLDGDYVDFAQDGTSDGDYSLGWGSVDPQGRVELEAPDTPGTYRLRYVVSIDGAHVLAETSIIVN